MFDLYRLDLQLFGGEGAAGGDGGDGAGAAPGETAPDAGETRLRELGVPESVLAKRAKRAKAPAAIAAAQRADAEPAAEAQTQTAPEPTEEGTTEDPSAATEPKRMTWDEIMADPEYNKQMQGVIQARLRSAKSAEETLAKLSPAFEVLARKYGLNADDLGADALTKAINDDTSYYEDKAVELGVPVETAMKIDQNEREAARRQREEARTIEQQKIAQHIEKLRAQGEAMKAAFPTFDLARELQNPAFARMTSPNVGISVEDAYYAVHRREIQSAAMKATAQKTAEQMANSIRAGQNRPVENGSSAQAPSITSFDYAKASKEQREALKRQIREAAAQGKKLYPGQIS